MSLSEPIEPQEHKSPKTFRFGARITARQKNLLQRAADLRGQSLTDFALSCIQETAERVIRDYEVIELTARESIAFVENLLNPPDPTDKQLKAAKRYQQRMATGR